MNDGWVETTLGNIAEWRGGMTPSMSNPAYWNSGDIPWISSKEVAGGVLVATEKRITSLAVEETSLRLLPPGSVVVVVRSGILLHTFPVAFVPFECTVNQDVKSASAVTGVDGRFLAYLIEANSEEILQRYRKTGTTVQSVDVPGLLSHRVSLPPLPVQRRIVDLMAHLDNQIANLRLERDAAESILWAMLTEWSSTGFSESTVTLGSVCNLRSGPSWAADSESRHWSPEARRVVKITNTRPDGSLDMTEETYVTGLPGSVALLSDASLILIRTNGNRGRIGNAYRPNSVALGCAVSAFQFVGDADSITDRDWIYWWLRVPAIQQEMSESASGTTGLGNLAVRWLRGLELPWPPLAERAKTVDLFNATLEHVQSISNELSAAQGLRTALLTTVLAAETLIDSLYDSLLDGVA